MDIEFENKFYTNDKMLKEYVNKVLSRNVRRIFLVYILIFLFIVKNGILKGDSSTIFRLIVCTIFLLFLNFLSQKYLFRLLKKTAKSIHNDQSYPTLVQFGNNIFMQEGKFSMELDYSKIVKIYYLKYSYILMFTNSNGIMVKYDSFTKGNFEDFKEFIKDNCKKAKIIVKNKSYIFGL
ncbi:YcxB family protein [Fusobacterium canifelinum]|uniref:YcxB family protein n=1 Tax=Fusobacterium canifelinum TaxID=285729 RepID=UPI0030CEC919